MENTWLFVGPQLLAGIGQVTKQYADLLGPRAEYCEVGQRPKRAAYDRGFAFVLPIQNQLDLFDQYKPFAPDWTYMTVCETEPVNECYGLLERYPEIHVPSEFSRQILEKQFPKIKWSLLRHWSKPKIPWTPVSTTPYVFYSIGNILDPRKNIKALVEAYLRCEFKDAAHLVLKATCNAPVDWKVPGVTIINGLLSSDDLEKVHAAGHCYVNCSHSEGVGMGAVEAALRAKPVVITDYGGLKEYVKTPWIVPCTVGPIGFDDFLFKKEHSWGHPDQNELERCLMDCFQKKVTSWDHAHTRELMDEVTCWPGWRQCNS
jgi:glycosyltransferase involved in cell wall biosynthesis